MVLVLIWVWNCDSILKCLVVKVSMVGFIVLCVISVRVWCLKVCRLLVFWFVVSLVCMCLILI